MKNEENNILFVFKYFRRKQRFLFTYLFFISKVTIDIKNIYHLCEQNFSWPLYLIVLR